jgi:NADPH2:quinone reductase
MFVKSLPEILSIEVVGTVSALGADVKSFKLGDKVFGQTMMSPDTAGLQEYAVLDYRVTGRVPINVSDDEAVTLPVCGIAAFVALFHSSGLGIPPPFETEEAKAFDYASQNIVIIGGGSNCGKMGIQFASLAGIGKVIAIAGILNAEKLKSYGATHVIDRHASNEDIKSQVQAIIGSDDLVYVLDAITPKEHTFAVSLLSSTKKGKVVTLLRGMVDEAKIGEKNAGYRINQTFGDSHLHREALGHDFWQYLPGWVESGKIKPLDFQVVEGGLNAEGVNKVLDNYKDGKDPGKWNVHPNA